MRDNIHALKRVSIFALSSLLLAVAACGSAQGDSGWDVDEDEDQPKKITHGIYEAEFEIVEDGCEPSLETIFGNEDNWPPPEVFVRHVNEESLDHDSVGFNAYMWRHGDFSFLRATVSKDGVPSSTYLGSEEIPSFSHFEHISCPYSFSDSPYLTRVESRQLTATTIELVFESSWGDLDECVQQRAWDEFATIPTSTCQEKYVVRYHLKEECATACEMRPNSLGGGRTDDGYPYVRYRESLRCVCNE